MASAVVSNITSSGFDWQVIGLENEWLIANYDFVVISTGSTTSGTLVAPSGVVQTIYGRFGGYSTPLTTKSEPAGTSFSYNCYVRTATDYYWFVGTVSGTTLGGETVPSTPSAPSASSITSSSFNASWGAVSGATSYTLNVFAWNMDTDYVVTGTSKLVTGLTAGTQYVIKVKATNAVGSSPWSGTTNVYSLPNTPSLSQGAVTATTIDINATCSGTISYIKVWGYRVSNGFALPVKTVASGGTLTYDSLTTGAQYSFYAQSYKADIDTYSASSPTIYVTTSAIPSNWEWSTSFLTQTELVTTVSGSVLKAQVITASEWNDYAAKIEEVAAYKSVSVSMSTVSSGLAMAAYVQQAVNALSALGQSVSYNNGSTLATKSFFYQLRDKLNAAI